MFLDPLHSFGIQNIAAIAVFLIGGGFTVALIAAISEASRRGFGGKRGDVYNIEAGNERYEIIEAFVFGG